MKSLATALSLAAVLGTAACNRPPSPAPAVFDTGNMAYPTPLPQGNIGSTAPSGPDVGNMAYPTSGGGALRPAPSTNDTGNMALPRRAQGNSTPTSRY